MIFRFKLAMLPELTRSIADVSRLLVSDTIGYISYSEAKLQTQISDLLPPGRIVGVS